MYDVEKLVNGIFSGDKRAIARSITLVESRLKEHREIAADLLERIVCNDKACFRIGVTGVPGVGKSTFIEALGNLVIQQGMKVAVLSIDPSSSLTGGSILGDKTRMELLSRRAEAYIRPSPSSGSLGGVARRTRESALILEAAGFDVIFIETVGVGQSETLVANMTDMFLLLLLPGGGDELQGIKRGIMELADLVVINKADGAQKDLAEKDVAEFTHAMRLMKARREQWKVPVVSCSALNATSVDQVWDNIRQFFKALDATGSLDSQRRQQRQQWFIDEINAGLLDVLENDPNLQQLLNHSRQLVDDGILVPTTAAAQLVKKILRF
ncbi:MAG: LAO/AO transport system kinase [Parasphingorhabdus sp.]